MVVGVKVDKVAVRVTLDNVKDWVAVAVESVLVTVNVESVAVLMVAVRDCDAVKDEVGDTDGEEETVKLGDSEGLDDMLGLKVSVMVTVRVTVFVLWVTVDWDTDGDKVAVEGVRLKVSVWVDMVTVLGVEVRVVVGAGLWVRVELGVGVIDETEGEKVKDDVGVRELVAVEGVDEVEEVGLAVRETLADGVKDCVDNVGVGVGVGVLEAVWVESVKVADQVDVAEYVGENVEDAVGVGVNDWVVVTVTVGVPESVKVGGCDTLLVAVEGLDDGVRLTVDRDGDWVTVDSVEE